MPGTNIKQVEATERSAIIRVASYAIDLDLTTGAENFRVKTTVKFAGLKPGATTYIDCVGARVISSKLNGADFDPRFDGETIYLPALAAENILEIEHDGVYSNSGEGLHRFVDPADDEVYLYTQFETGDARRMYACFDQPDQKATFAISTITPDHWEIISNYAIESTKDLGSKKKFTQFANSQVISTYVTAIVAGAYTSVHDEYKGEKTIPLGIYARKSFFKHVDAANIFEVTKQGFAYFEKTFGLAYPFGKYDQIAVAEYNWGAMENVGCVTFHEDVLIFRSKVTERNYVSRATTIHHEMAHMWFGDLVTMQWWNDLWLNESFAEWASYQSVSESTKYTEAWTEFNSLRKNWAYRVDQLTTTHPIATEMEDLDAVRTNFDGISYAKGASVLQQLVAHVGRDNFITGLRRYFAKHAFGSTTLKDLIDQLEAASGRDLTPWVATWLRTAGVNTLRPVIALAGDTYASLSIKQEVPTMPVGSTELRPHRLHVGLFDIQGSKLVRRTSVELDIAGALTEVTAFTGQKSADLVLINDKDQTYAKLRFDERSIATMKSHLGSLDDSLARGLIWASLWDSCRDGELSATDYIAIALAALKNESDISIVSATLGQIDTALWAYAHPAHRPALRLQVASAIEAALDAAKAGSDHQLQFAKGFANTAITPEQLERIKAILGGSITGLTIDAELRWFLFICGVKRGVFGPADIEKELALDKTAHGKQYGAMAYAQIPSKDAKAKAFSSITTDDLSNTIHSYKCRGFNDPLHTEILSDFVDQYFDVLLKVWQTKGYEIAETTATLLFPSWVISEATVKKAQHWLDVTGKEASHALRRTILESRDAMVRALKAQAADK
ncbi:MAG: aminopeptidase N [Actinobacteria bacterium]|nr:aminopeptidase N [Candidatus Planktophila sp.]PHX69722.1 MAG: aminopeptidase N [Actinomycetota bacterium]